MASPSSGRGLKGYFNSHSTYIDFLSASLIISLCIIVLLPKVHESFQADYGSRIERALTTSANQERTNENLRAFLDEQTVERNQDDHHQPPIGEILVCIGFLVFYCLGLCLTKDHQECSSLAIEASTAPTVCCPSTRCPTLPATQQTAPGQPSSDAIGSAEVANSDQAEESCLMLLNRHHNHHVHASHHYHGRHYHGQGAPRYASIQQKSSYGTVQPPTYQSHSVTAELYDDSTWPMTTKVTAFSLVFAGLLILLDLHMQGVMQALKVFRAGATGALLYVAFYLVLPRNSAGCRTCTEEVAC